MVTISAASLFARDDASDDSPFAMLRACHDRIRDRLATLRRLAAHLPVHGADRQARDAAASILRYFDEAAPKHHQDEEEDLFPALRTAVEDDADARERLRTMTVRIEAEHRRFETLWEPVEPVLRALAAGEASSAALPPQAVEALADAYLSHIELEEGELLPFAARHLDEPALRRLADAMAARRGLVR